jgi:maspardin
MTIFIIGILGLIFIIAINYYFPSPTDSFEKLYAKVPDEQRSSFMTFRSENNLRHTTVNGIEWRYLTTGTGSKTIVFLHGMGGGYDIWWQQINYFKTDYRVISMTYPPIQNLADLSAGISAILDEERIDKTHIVGSSLGGYFAQYLVKNYSERIEKAVFANTFPPNHIISKKAGRFAKMLHWLPEWFIMRNLRRTTANAIYPASGNSELVGAYMMEQSCGMMSKAQFAARLNCVLDYFEPPDIVKYGIPALIIESDNDPLVSEELRELLKFCYPSAPVETFHQKGHFPYLNEPAEYNRTLDHFLSGN